MLREILIVHKKQIILYKKFGKSFTWDKISYLIYLLDDLTENLDKDTFNFLNLIKYRIIYFFESTLKYLILLIVDFNDKLLDIKNGIKDLKDEFKNYIEVSQNGEIKILDYDPLYQIILSFFKELSPKIVFIGLGGVGKTTITKLIRAEDIPTNHIPTVVGNIVNIKIGNLTFTGWDLAGQEQFSFIWNKFIRKSDIIFIVVDSSESVSKIKRNKYFIDLIKRESPNSKVAAIANKQDMDRAKSPEIIQKILEVPTFPLVAIDEDQRVNMLSYIADILELSEEIHALIEPMVIRDDLIQLAELTLELSGNLNKVSKIYEQIAILSNELGEKGLANYFFSKSKTISQSIDDYITNLKKKHGIIKIKNSSTNLIDFNILNEKNEQINSINNKIIELDDKISLIKNKMSNPKIYKNKKVFNDLQKEFDSLNQEKELLKEKLVELRINKIQYLII
ncbi:MAG: ADP-ribosylation factor-like protein [Candidatus Helarchaeota archaeon]